MLAGYSQDPAATRPVLAHKQGKTGTFGRDGASKLVGYNPIVPLNLVRFLALIMALAVPIQGMAAVIAGQCMALEHQDAPRHVSHGDPQDGQGGHDHAAHSHQDEAGGNADSDGAGSNGSHCGPCTASAAIAGPAALSIVSGASNAPHVFSQFAPSGVPLDGFDRPPTAL